jgi:hypothetical protein
VPAIPDNFFSLPGDYNHNGIVDTTDYTVWRDSLGQIGLGLATDGNVSGQIDAGDCDVWKANFLAITGSGSVASADAAIPEPVTLVLTLLGALLYGLVDARPTILLASWGETPTGAG